MVSSKEPSTYLSKKSPNNLCEKIILLYCRHSDMGGMIFELNLMNNYKLRFKKALNIALSMCKSFWDLKSSENIY